MANTTTFFPIRTDSDTASARRLMRRIRVHLDTKVFGVMLVYKFALNVHFPFEVEL
jgi:hypothetical protein